jgi:hypothetical protein
MMTLTNGVRLGKFVIADLFIVVTRGTKVADLDFKAAHMPTATTEAK